MWQNSVRVRDVNFDGFLSPSDVLVGVNRLNELGSSVQLPDRTSESDEPYYDVNGDGWLAPNDLVLVINALNGEEPVSVELANDTGVEGDLRTQDASVAGKLADGFARLLGKVTPEQPWTDLSEFVLRDGTFELTADELAAHLAFSGDDGDHTLYFSGVGEQQTETLADAIPLTFRLDTTAPKLGLALGDQLVTAGGHIVIPLDEPITMHSFERLQVLLFDTTWGELPEGGPWGDDGRHPRIPMSPQSVELSTDGSVIFVKPPFATRSTNYLVEVSGIIEDVAGNKTAVADSAPLEFRANTFTAAVNQLEWGKTYEIPIEFRSVGKIREYSFVLEHDDVVLWHGERQFGALGRFDLYSRGGALIDRLHPGTLDDPGEAGTPKAWNLTAGEYVLRLVEPTVNYSEFKLDLLSSTPELPSSMAPLGLDQHGTLQAFSADLVEGERLLFDSGSYGTQVVEAVYSPAGEQLSAVQFHGMDLFEVPQSGRYMLAVRGVGYQLHRSTPRTLEASYGEPVHLSMIPGQQAVVRVPTTIGDTVVWHGGGSEFEPLVFRTGAKAELRPARGLLIADSEYIEFVFTANATAEVPTNFLANNIEDLPALPLGNEVDPSDAVGMFRIVDNLGISSASEPLRIQVVGSRFTLTRANLAINRLSGATVHFYEADPTVLVVPSGTTSWKTIVPTFRSEPLPSNEVQVHFDQSFLTREFTLSLEHGELINVDWTHSLQNLIDVELVDPFGNSVEQRDVFIPQLPFSSIWRAEFSGQYKLRLSAKVLDRPHYTILRISNSRDWPLIEPNTEYGLSEFEIKWFQFPPEIDFPTLEGNRIYAVVDSLGNEIFPESPLAVDPSPGTQYFLIINSFDGDGTLEWIDPTPADDPPMLPANDYEIGARLTGTVPQDNAIERFGFTVEQTTQLVNLSTRSGTLILPDGRRRDFDSFATRHVSPGNYQFELTGPAGQYELQLADVSKAQLIDGVGQYSVNTFGSQAFALFRIGDIEEALIVEPHAGLDARIFGISESGAEEPGSFGPLVDAQLSGKIIAARGAQQIDVSLFADRLKRFELSANRQASGAIEKPLESHSYQFEIDETDLATLTADIPTDISAGDFEITLRLPDGGKISIERGTPQNIVPMAGSFELEITGEQAFEYSLTLEEFDALPIQWSAQSELDPARPYEFQTESFARYAIRLVDNDGVTIDPQSFSIASYADGVTLHEAKLENGIGLGEGKHVLRWLDATLRPDGSIFLMTSEINTLSQVANDATVRPADFNTPHIVDMTASDFGTVLRFSPDSSGVIIPSNLSISEGVHARFRIYSENDPANSIPGDWQPIADLDDLLSLSEDQLLEVYLEGEGQSTIEFTSLQSAPTLPLGHQISISMPEHQSALVWKLPNTPGTRIEFDLSNTFGQEWAILDRRGELVEGLEGLGTIVIANAEDYYLSLVRSDDLSQDEITGSINLKSLLT